MNDERASSVDPIVIRLTKVNNPKEGVKICSFQDIRAIRLLSSGARRVRRAVELGMTLYTSPGKLSKNCLGRSYFKGVLLLLRITVFVVTYSIARGCYVRL